MSFGMGLPTAGKGFGLRLAASMTDGRQRIVHAGSLSVAAVTNELQYPSGWHDTCT